MNTIVSPSFPIRSIWKRRGTLIVIGNKLSNWNDLLRKYKASCVLSSLPTWWSNWIWSWWTISYDVMRLKNAVLPFDAKFPMLLPPESHLTELIIWHHNTHHPLGISELIFVIRRQFYFTLMRKTIKKMVRPCILKTTPGAYNTTVTSLTIVRKFSTLVYFS